jgi:hypothetical protein
MGLGYSCAAAHSTTRSLECVGSTRAVWEAVDMKDRKIARVEFSEVFEPHSSRPSSNEPLKVEVRGIEPLSLGDRSGLLRAQPAVNLASRLPPAEDLSASPGAMSGSDPRADPSP